MTFWSLRDYINYQTLISPSSSSSILMVIIINWDVFWLLIYEWEYLMLQGGWEMPGLSTHLISWLDEDESGENEHCWLWGASDCYCHAWRTAHEGTKRDIFNFSVNFRPHAASGNWWLTECINHHLCIFLSLFRGKQKNKRFQDGADDDQANICDNHGHHW